MANTGRVGGAQGAAPQTGRNAQQPAAAETQERDPNVSFMTVAEFKTAIGANTLSVLRSPKTDKLFMATNDGRNFKVQGDIDQSLDIRVLVPDNGDLENACLVNVEGGAEQLFTL